MNRLLRRDAAARQRGLSMRTYRVVPIAPTAGVLQWVENTQTLGGYLVNGPDSAHDRYRPDDLSFKQCREQVRLAAIEVESGKKPSSYKLLKYKECTSRFQPVFHHFFLERWGQPAEWFDHRAVTGLASAFEFSTGVGVLVMLFESGWDLAKHPVSILKLSLQNALSRAHQPRLVYWPALVVSHLPLVARRLAYASSLAAGSMIGFVLGLGDRHVCLPALWGMGSEAPLGRGDVGSGLGRLAGGGGSLGRGVGGGSLLSNILIDLHTAQLVHIDFGFAFESGKLLNVPELVRITSIRMSRVIRLSLDEHTVVNKYKHFINSLLEVPFRLTRDLEDGLGICGVEGLLRGGAEHTMRVLRANSNSLTTILQAMRHMGGDKYFLFKCGLKQKLAGHVHGGELSVEGQVRQLLDEARDPEHLARMFYGWSAWV
ncbi:MAG: hypothetical protein SGPRY_002440 [Prymnesium sp.]